MLTLTAKKRSGNKQEKGTIPAVLYGPEINNINLTLNTKEFSKVFKDAGETSLITLDVEGKNFSVLIHEIERDSVSGAAIHIDFYQPILTKQLEATVPLIFMGEAPAVKELGGTLIKEIKEIVVKALPQNIPHEIRVPVENLKAFNDEILIRDLVIPVGVTIQRNADEIVALVLPPQKVEEELEKPIEEKVEEIEKVEKKKEAAEPETEETTEEKPAQ